MHMENILVLVLSTTVRNKVAKSWGLSMFLLLLLKKVELERGKCEWV